MTISKHCDMPSCFLFVVVAGTNVKCGGRNDEVRDAMAMCYTFHFHTTTAQQYLPLNHISGGAHHTITTSHITPHFTYLIPPDHTSHDMMWNIMQRQMLGDVAPYPSVAVMWNN